MPRTTAEAIPLDQQPGHLIRRAHQISVSTCHDTHGRGVTPIQYAVLRVLQDKPGIDQVTLAAAAALDTSTTADLAVRLEGKGWISRDLRSRGQRSLVLTAEGEAVLRAMLPGMQRMQQALLASLDAVEQAEFTRLLKKFVDGESASRGTTPKPAGGALPKTRRTPRSGP